MTFLGFPILAGFFLSLWQPGFGLKIIPFGFGILFFITVLASLETEINIFQKKVLMPLVQGLFWIQIFWPILLYLLSELFLENATLREGILWAALTPIALVAPIFTGLLGGDREFSFGLLLASMLLYPLTCTLSYLLFRGEAFPFGWSTLLVDAVLLSTVPVLLGFALRLFVMKRLSRYSQICIKKAIPWAASILIGVLAFSYFGFVQHKTSSLVLSGTDLPVLLCMAAFFDFGVYWLSPFLHMGSFTAEQKISVRVSASMRNVAISSSLLFLHRPSASISSTVIFLVHGVFFSYLGWCATFVKSKTGQSPAYSRNPLS